MNGATLRGNQNRPDFTDAEKLFLLFEYPRDSDSPGHDEATEAIFVLPRLDTKRAKRQQQTRRKDNLFKKAREYSLECGAHVYLAIKIKKNGRIFTFNSDSTGEWPLPESQMARHPLSERSLGY